MNMEVSLWLLVNVYSKDKSRLNVYLQLLWLVLLQLTHHHYVYARQINGSLDDGICSWDHIWTNKNQQSACLDLIHGSECPLYMIVLDCSHFIDWVCFLISVDFCSFSTFSTMSFSIVFSCHHWIMKSFAPCYHLSKLHFQINKMITYYY